MMTVPQPPHGLRKRVRKPLAPPPAFLAEDVLLTAREAAAYRRQGLSTFWRDVKAGTVPPPIRITLRAPRWRLSTLRAAEVAP
jgi:predicted DNA-binding transcriptional regulator AlpA